MRFKKNFNVDMELVIDVYHYIPFRPAPYCQNPSNMDYSDPGDTEELEFMVSIEIDGKKKLLTESQHELLYDQIYTEVLEWLENENCGVIK